MSGRKVAVIGSGVGGSALASLLQIRGYDVTVFERHRFCGGRCSSFERDGYTVDDGVHMFSMCGSGPHGEVCILTGARIEWRTRDPGVFFRVGGDRGLFYFQKPLKSRGIGQILRIAAYAAESAATEPRAVVTTGRRLRGASSRLYRAARRGGTGAILREIRGLVALDPALLEELDEVTTAEFVSSFTDNRALHRGFASSSMVLLVVPYTESSAGEFVWCVVNMMRKASLGFPLGGSSAVPKAFLRAFLHNGGRLETGMEVEKIAVSGGEARGVVTADGMMHDADLVVSNAGLRRTIEMAGGRNFPVEYVRRAHSLRYSHSFLTVKYGLARKVLDTGAPCFFNVPDTDPREMFDYIPAGGTPDDPFLFVTVPTDWDPGLAPPGKQLVIMGVPGPSDPGDDPVSQCERILDRAEEKLFEIFPAMEKNVDWKRRTHSRHTADIAGRHTGDCIGLAQCVGQTGRHRPAQETPVRGLYLVGCDAGARGVGTEQASASALELGRLMYESVYR